MQRTARQEVISRNFSRNFTKNSRLFLLYRFEQERTILVKNYENDLQSMIDQQKKQVLDFTKNSRNFHTNFTISRNFRSKRQKNSNMLTSKWLLRKLELTKKKSWKISGKFSISRNFCQTLISRFFTNFFTGKVSNKN